MKKSARRTLVGVALGVAAMLSMGAQTALAGEITGNGKVLSVQGKSICAFSGQNDEFQLGDETAPRVQSFGQIVREVGPLGGIPGVACNPSGR